MCYTKSLKKYHEYVLQKTGILGIIFNKIQGPCFLEIPWKKHIFVSKFYILTDAQHMTSKLLSYFDNLPKGNQMILRFNF